jgi:hypothetical protein
VCSTAESAVVRASARVRAGTAASLELVSGSGFALAGRVADEGGRPLAGALVFAAERPWSVLPDERFGVAARCDERGRFRLAGIAPRAVWIVADAGAGRRAETLVRAGEGAELRRDFALSEGHSLAGRVLDEAGDGIAGCGIVVVAPDEWPPLRTTSAADGSFRVAVDSTLPHRIWFEERGERLAREVAARPAADEVVVRLADSERRCLPASHEASSGSAP